MSNPDPDVYRRLEALERWQDVMAAVERPITGAGTWTPTFVGTTTAGTYTYTAQRGAYVRVNALCIAWATLVISAIGTPPVGDMTIAGLPFAAASVGGGVRFPPALDVSNLDYPAGALEIVGYVLPATSAINLGYTRDNLGRLNYPAASFTNAAVNIALTLAYAV